MLFDQRIGFDLGFDGGRFKFTLRNRANDAEVVACRLQKHRNRPGHDDGMQDGLVAVAVYHHHIIGCHRVMPHHLVAGRGAVGYKKAVVSVKNAGRITLTFTDGTIVIQQLTQFFNGVAHVGAQHVLAIKLVIHLPHRAFQKGHATRMAWAVPGIGAIFSIVQQGFKNGGCTPSR